MKQRRGAGGEGYSKLHPMHYPRHIGIIPDGNRTWAKEKDLPSIFGHKAGFERSKDLVKYCLGQTPIEVITLW